MDEKFLLSKMDAVIASEKAKADFSDDDVVKVRAETEKAVREKHVKRFDDLRNFVHGRFDGIAREKGFQFY
jgi:hypothetical protein